MHEQIMTQFLTLLEKVSLFPADKSIRANMAMGEMLVELVDAKQLFIASVLCSYAWCQSVAELKFK